MNLKKQRSINQMNINNINTKNQIIEYCKRSMCEYQKRYDKNNKHDDFLKITFFAAKIKELKNRGV